jgi:hypothetical protein
MASRRVNNPVAGSFRAAFNSLNLIGATLPDSWKSCQLRPVKDPQPSGRSAPLSLDGYGRKALGHVAGAENDNVHWGFFDLGRPSGADSSI